MDLQLFQAINNFAGRWHWLDWLGRFVATDVAFIIMAVLAVVWYTRPATRRVVVTSVIAAAGARAIVSVIRFFYHHPRPISVDAVHRLVVNTEWSFPSGHASFFFALSTVIFLYNRRWGIVLYVVSLLMGLARIFVGVHWPSDILGGIVLGVVTGAVVNLIAKRLVPLQEG